MAINRPEHFALSFNGQYSIGDIWWGNGIWVKPLDFPGGLSYWTFGILPNTTMWTNGGWWATTTNVIDLTEACNSAGQEYVDSYNYGTAYHLDQWGGDKEGDEFWDFLINYCNDQYYWLWGDVYSGLAIMRAGNNQYKFLATYGLYENNQGHQKIAATSSNTFTREQLQEGAFTWYTNMSTETDGITSWNSVYWFCKNASQATALETATYTATDYDSGFIMYGYLDQQSVADSILGGKSSNAFGGAFPAKVTKLNSANSPYGGPGSVYTPDHMPNIDDSYTLVSGGPFTEATDSAADSWYTPAGGAGGGGGYDLGSDPVGSADASQFATDALNSGLLTVFNPTKAQLIDFAKFIYNSDNITEAIANQLKRLMADPLDYIIGLNMAHFTPTVSGSNIINFGGVSTGVSAGIVSPQMQFINCGTLQIKEETASFQDYDMSRVQIYIPYCGIHELDIKEVMNSSITCKLIIDCLTGSVVADLIISKSAAHTGESELDSILYTFTGNCFQSIPITSRDFQSTISGLLGVASSAGSFTAGITPAGISGVINSAMSMTPKASRIGNFSSNYGYMQAQKPYLILTRPIASVPSMFEDYYGRPLYNLEKLNNCEGYVEIDPGTLWTGLYDFITSEEEEMLKSIVSSGGIYIDHTSEYYDYNPEDE